MKYDAAFPVIGGYDIPRVTLASTVNTRPFLGGSGYTERLLRVTGSSGLPAEVQQGVVFIYMYLRAKGSFIDSIFPCTMESISTCTWLEACNSQIKPLTTVAPNVADLLSWRGREALGGRPRGG